METTCHTHAHTDSFITTNKMRVLNNSNQFEMTCTKLQDSKLHTSPHVLFQCIVWNKAKHH